MSSVSKVVRLSSVAPLLLAVSMIGATPAPSPMPSYSLDGITLGSSVDDAIRNLGKPHSSGNKTYEWNNTAGGKITALVNPSRHVVVIDVLVGAHERRRVDVAGGGGILGESGHVNFLEPPKSSARDLCGPRFVGSPCIAYTLPGDVDLVANFGMNDGLSDWALSELVLGNRDLMLASGGVIAKSQSQ